MAVLWRINYVIYC